MPTIINIPRVYRLNLLHFYDALTPVLDHPKRKRIFLYFITKELSNLGFNVGILYRYHYEKIDRQSLHDVEFLIKHEMNSLFLGVYANYEIIIRPYSDFIYDFTIY